MQQNIRCPQCGRYFVVNLSGQPGMYALKCPSCGHQFRTELSPYVQPIQQPISPLPRKTNMAMVGGILLVLSAVAQLGILLFIGIFAFQYFSSVTIYSSAYLFLCLGIPIVCLPFTLLGGIYALQKKHFIVAIAGAVCGIIGGGGSVFMFGYLGSLLSLLALIFIGLSRDEFIS